MYTTQLPSGRSVAERNMNSRSFTRTLESLYNPTRIEQHSLFSPTPLDEKRLLYNVGRFVAAFKCPVVHAALRHVSISLVRDNALL